MSAHSVSTQKGGALRWIVAIAIGVVALNLILAGLNSAFRNPGGPRSSTYATGPDGLAAYAELLGGEGHQVAPLRGSLEDADLDPDTTVVVLDPDALAPADIEGLERFVTSGGRLIIGGGVPTYVEDLVPDPPEWASRSSTTALPLAPVPETAGISEVRSAGAGSWSELGGALPALGTEEDTLLAITKVGTGRALLMADATPLHNAFLGRKDNAALGLALAGPAGRPGLFAEGVHGYGDETGLRALPWRWRFALVGIGVAAIVWMFARGRRLGPPEETHRALAPPRRDFVDALAATLARTRRRNEAVAPVRAAARALVASRSGAHGHIDDNTFAHAAREQGLTDDEILALLMPADDDEDVMAIGRALARLNQEGVGR